jgi:hypothetical protein
MGKAEILAELTANGQVSVFRRSFSWEKAFELYNKENKAHKNMNCGTCFRDVLTWLRS